VVGQWRLRALALKVGKTFATATDYRSTGKYSPFAIKWTPDVTYSTNIYFSDYAGQQVLWSSIWGNDSGQIIVEESKTGRVDYKLEKNYLQWEFTWKKSYGSVRIYIRDKTNVSSLLANFYTYLDSNDTNYYLGEVCDDKICNVINLYTEDMQTKKSKYTSSTSYHDFVIYYAPSSSQNPPLDRDRSIRFSDNKVVTFTMSPTTSFYSINLYQQGVGSRRHICSCKYSELAPKLRELWNGGMSEVLVVFYRNNSSWPTLTVNMKKP